MKKVINILGLVLVAITLCFNVSVFADSETDVDLASLIKIANANAEGTDPNCGYKLEIINTNTTTGRVDNCYLKVTTTTTTCEGEDGSVCCYEGSMTTSETDCPEE